MLKVIFLEIADVAHLMGYVKDRIGSRNLPIFERGFVLYDGRQETYCEFVVADGRKRYEILARVEFFQPKSVKEIAIKSITTQGYKDYKNFAFSRDEEANLFERLQQLYTDEKAEKFHEIAYLAGKNLRQLKEEISRYYPSISGLPGALAGFLLMHYFGDRVPYLPESISAFGSQGLEYKEVLGLGIGGFLNTMYLRWTASNREIANRKKHILNQIKGLEDVLK